MLFNPFALHLGSNLLLTCGRCLIPLLNHICHSCGVSSSRFRGPERMTWGITGCDTGLATIFSAVTHKRCRCATARDIRQSRCFFSSSHNLGIKKKKKKTKRQKTATLKMSEVDFTLRQWRATFCVFHISWTALAKQWGKGGRVPRTSITGISSGLVSFAGLTSATDTLWHLTKLPPKPVRT